jgi:monoamine oxidase
MQTDVLVIGAGLAGLGLARILEERGDEFLIVEARDRIGGRILSQTGAESGGLDTSYDLGPAWFWTGQPRLARLASEFGLDIFEQYATGRLTFQDAAGSIRRDLEMAPMAGSLRIAGGMTGLVEGLLQGLPEDRLLIGHCLTKLSRRGSQIHATLHRRAVEVDVTAQRVVLAVPPRVAENSIQFEPELPIDVRVALRAIPTWMAGHAKVVVVYDRPFWRDSGLSGDAISHRGPLTEIHDASPHSASKGALFGFVGAPAAVRRSSGSDLQAAALAQLSTLFGLDAGNPIEVLFHDWADEYFTATDKDDISPNGHPAYGTPLALESLWDGSLILSSSEMAATFGGFLEGALEAAEYTARRLLIRSAGDN